MGMLDDTEIFLAVIEQKGFSHAAKHLGLSNGLISRRIGGLEKNLGVSLIKRTTREFHLTKEGEVFLHHAQRIQNEMDAACNLIQSYSHKAKGAIRVSAPSYFGRTYLTPMIKNFLHHFPDIKVDLFLSNQRYDPIKEQFDLIIRGAGYLASATLKDSSMQMKLLVKEKVGLYASEDYLKKYGKPTSPEQLTEHAIINYSSTVSPADEQWIYCLAGKKHRVNITAKFNSNDIESNLMACVAGLGIGRFTTLNAKRALAMQQLQEILTNYDWGSYHLYAVYPQQRALPKRTRLFLEFIKKHLSSFAESSGGPSLRSG